MKISEKYNWLGQISDAPKMIIEAVKLGRLNTTEVPGPKSNQEILALAKEANVSSIYKSDETAWCALAHTVIALRSGKEVLFEQYGRLRARSFATWGKKVDEPMFGDTCIFSRPGGDHVGLYVGEDSEAYHIAGGNQSNQYCVIRIAKNRLTNARRPIFKTGQPASVKKIFLDASGYMSENEA